MGKSIFHLAFPVHNLKSAKAFYVKGLGCRAGRESGHSLILNLAGHQIVAQLTPERPKSQKGIYPRHFGLVFLKRQDWEDVLSRALKKGLPFYQAPKIRFPKSALEHRTFFLKDPSNNLLEFKHYTHKLAIFGKRGMKKVGDRP